MAPLLAEVGAVMVGAAPPKATLAELNAKPERVGVWPVTVKLVVAVALEKLPDAA